MKLLRKDVLKWIRLLKSGRYKKGKNLLVQHAKGGDKFCCLGVWADQHGAVWKEDSFGSLIPFLETGKKEPRNTENFLYNPRLSRGLSEDLQKRLANVNDTTKDFTQVIELIKDQVLPLAAK